MKKIENRKRKEEKKGEMDPREPLGPARKSARGPGKKPESVRCFFSLPR
jgi:hypothetical protein